MEKIASSVADPSAQLQLLPGFRFHPTDEELVVHYLSRKAAARPFPIQIIAELDLYKFDPWDLPQKALFGEREWYFFSPRDRKYPNGARPNRAAASGYWKATGTDKPIYSSTAGGLQQKVGVKKALVFYKGRAPRGVKTNWIMHEYRLTDSGGKPSHAKRKGSLRLDDWVLCRIYNRCVGSQKLKLPDQKLEVEEESCLEDVLASLPDIDDSKIFLPRIGPLQTSIQHEDFLLERFLSGDMSEDGSKSVLSQTDLGNFQGRIMQNSGTDDHSMLQEDSRLSSADLDHPFDINFSESCESEHLSDHSPRFDRSLRRPRESNMPDILQNLRSVRQRVISFDSADDEVQSTCRSPIFSRQQSKQQGSKFEFPLYGSSAEKCFQPDFVQAKTENESSFFVNMDDLFPGHLN
ncbi:hypothetical protein O6H91_14G028900 [Diphasiastrum complanatum]|uniref:Uncharacterized protein n=1 Tax=Diphasiastrum complanatum TaxID=34168 RepID=A0ACC2BMN6_DIPCM|nr:hypothetical protein O6H91_14G028900 [Diphasiastrum complanatum]